LRARLGIRPGEFAVGYLGIFIERKSQLPFIREAAARLVRSVPDAKVYFIGDFDAERNEYARRCSEAVSELGLGSRVSFVGYTPDVADWYRALDSVAVASRMEGLSRGMIEALACGTPVVSFEVCSAKEVLAENGCGFVVQHGDYGALVEGLARLAADEVERRRLGERGVHAARELFDPRRVVGEYEELYFSLLEA
jgi:glycosyltransferase involved in cell wall biosynthesis